MNKLKQEDLGSKYQYQQQTADPEHIYRSTLLGISLSKTLEAMKLRPSDCTLIWEKFDKAF